MSRSDKKSVQNPPARDSLRASAGTASTLVQSPDDGAPFGTRPPRSRVPLLFWCALYFGWFCVLVYFATFTVGLK
jgi:hypothetical protein